MSFIVSFVDSIFEQTFQRHPYLFLFVILCSGMVLGHSYSVFAQDDDVDAKFAQHEEDVGVKFEELHSKIDTITKTVNDNYEWQSEQFTQQAVRQINSRIYDLTNVINSGKGNARDHNTLKDLKADLEVEKRKLR